MSGFKHNVSWLSYSAYNTIKITALADRSTMAGEYTGEIYRKNKDSLDMTMKFALCWIVAPSVKYFSGTAEPFSIDVVGTKTELKIHINPYSHLRVSSGACGAVSFIDLKTSTPSSSFDAFE